MKGEVRVSKVIKEMTSLDCALWQAYDSLYPFGQHHTDYLIAQLTTVVFNAWKGKDTPSLTTNEVLGIFVPLTEDKVSATLRSFKGGTN